MKMTEFSFQKNLPRRYVICEFNTALENGVYTSDWRVIIHVKNYSCSRQKFRKTVLNVFRNHTHILHFRKRYTLQCTSTILSWNKQKELIEQLEQDYKKRRTEAIQDMKRSGLEPYIHFLNSINVYFLNGNISNLWLYTFFWKISRGVFGSEQLAMLEDEDEDDDVYVSMKVNIVMCPWFMHVFLIYFLTIQLHVNVKAYFLELSGIFLRELGHIHICNVQ